jgi:tellurite resistance protein TerC
LGFRCGEKNLVILFPETLFFAAAANPPAVADGQPTVSLWFWLGFCVIVAVLLALDMFVFHRKDHTPTLKESAGWTTFWTALALTFNGWIWWWFGDEYAIQFFTGYLVEWSLSMDNVFVFAVIFAYFRVPLKYQYRVLFWGIFGAIVMRLTFILLAAELLKRFEWIMYIFGAILLWSGIKLGWAGDTEIHPEDNRIVKLARRRFRVSSQLHGNRFFVREKGKLAVTPLFLVLLVVESTDVVFAVDSVPAIFGVTDVPFIVFTSNVFAIMGLRALYFLLAGVMDMFRYLHYGLAAVLCFIGIKMLAHHWLEDEEFLLQLPQWALTMTSHGELRLAYWIPLVIIASILGISIVASLIAGREEKGEIVEEKSSLRELASGSSGEEHGDPAAEPPSAGNDGSDRSPDAVESSRTTT